MKRWRILLWVLAVGLPVVVPGVGCSSKEETEEQEQEKKEKAIAVSLVNVRAICRGCVMYADSHEQKIPGSLEELKTFLGGRIMLKSPRQPEDFDGPGYIFVKVLGGKDMRKFRPAYEYVIVYENPAFCQDYINVGFLDGHEEKMTLPAFRKSLQETYQKLGEPVPDGILK
jgi:prepilin-type processing-associated H-X9-DG protein